MGSIPAIPYARNELMHIYLARSMEKASYVKQMQQSKVLEIRLTWLK
jgi:hypothetical protein